MNSNNYKYYIYFYKDSEGRPVVKAVSTYAGKNVCGTAKCSTEDTYDQGKGIELAKLRCRKNIAKKRLKNAQAKINRIQNEYKKIQKELDKAKKYKNETVADIMALENTETTLLKAL
jgi:hypothetical protein